MENSGAVTPGQATNQNSIFTEEATKFREYLEKLLDLTKWAFGLVGIVVLGGIGLFGAKTLWDIDDRVTAKTDDAVKALVSREAVRELLDFEVRTYADKALVASLLTEASFDSRNREMHLDDRTIEVLLRISGEPRNPLFEQTMALLRKPCSEIYQNRGRFGERIHAALRRQIQEPEKGYMTPDGQVEAISVLSVLSYENSSPTLERVALEARFEGRIRREAALGLTRLSPRSRAPDLAQSLAEGGRRVSEDDPETSAALLVSAAIIDIGSVKKELFELARQSATKKIELASTILMHPEMVRTFVTRAVVLRDDATQIVRSQPDGEYLALVSAWVANPQVQFALKPSYSGQGENFGVIVDAAVRSEAVARMSSLSLTFGVVAEAGAAAAGKMSRADFEDLMRRVVGPLSQATVAQLKQERWRGIVGDAVDRFDWQDGFVISYPANGGNLYLIESFDDKTKLMVLYGPQSAKTRASIAVPIGDVRPAGFSWRRVIK